ncbi:two-component sensor histidine kinase, partial [Corallococcus llansteffanensis]
MTHEPPRPTAPPLPTRLPLLEDPEHPGLFVVRRIGTLTLLLVAGLCA